MSAHDAVTLFLAWLAIGSLIWCALFCSGLIQKTCAKFGGLRWSIVLASVAAIVCWPVFAGAMLGRLAREPQQ